MVFKPRVKSLCSIIYILKVFRKEQFSDEGWKPKV